ncbi:group I truncated hemoglobin [Streptomyces odontomachi]|uniref:group I truncated hemoglobin n=1 Tax=Streptomyces odontomachi TaxID=2944940 RepID=UPI002109ADBD|nr:group 1 truncated hemoglobin [Streptomyces sp. ODS25]
MTEPSQAAPAQSASTLFDRIGGDEAVGAVVDLFYDRVLADPDLAPYFTDVGIRRLKNHQRLFIGQALGSTRPYPGRSMHRAHAHLGITRAAFDRVVEHLAASLGEAGVDEGTIGTIAEALAPLADDIVTAPEPTPPAS